MGWHLFTGGCAIPARDLYSEPTPEYLQDFYEHVAVGPFWSPQRTVDTEILELMWDEHEILLPDTNDPKRIKQFKPEIMRSGEGRRVVDQLTSFYVKRSDLSLRYLGEGERGPAEMDRIEQAVNISLDLVDTKSPHGDSPRWAQVQDLIGLGRTARLGPMPGSAYWYEDFPVRGDQSEEEWTKTRKQWRHGPLPVTWMHLPAQSTWPASFGSTEDECVSILKATWWELQETFPEQELAKVMPSDSKHWQDEVTLLIHSNRKYVTYAIADQSGRGMNPLGKHAAVMRSLEHDMGKSVIQITAGIISPQKVPGKGWLSVLYPVRALIKAADTGLSLALTSAKISAMPEFKGWFNTNRDNSTAAPPESRRQIGPGNIWPLNPGNAETGEGREDIQAIHMPENADLTLFLVNFALDRAAQMTYSTDAIAGREGLAGEPAWSRNSKIQQTQIGLSRVTYSVTNMDKSDGQMMIDALAAFGEELPLNTETGEFILKPSMLKGWELQLQASYVLSTPIDLGARAEHGISLMERRNAMGALFPSDVRIARENFGIEQPYVEARETMTWDLFKSMRPLVEDTLRKELEADIASDAGITAAELEGLRGQIAPQAFEVLMERALASQGGQPPASPNGPTGDAINAPAGGGVPKARAAGI